MLQRHELIFRQYAAVQQRSDQCEFRIDSEGYGQRATVELSAADTDGGEVSVVKEIAPIR